ncbi:MAG: bifunctional precorrin-2 dehydrogenase/sirohydrochlorin ferrochelatase [Lachnotalea sp.]
MSNLRFPMFISLENKSIIIFGGGKVAYRRANTLLLFHADVTVIAPQVIEEIVLLMERKQLRIMKEYYAEQYINETVFMVIAATNDEKINSEIYDKCKSSGILVNNASNQLQCDFFFPAVITDENIVIGVSGDGRNHKKVSELAKKIRLDIQE